MIAPEKTRDPPLTLRCLVSEAVIVGETSIDPTDYRRRPWLYQEVVHTAPGRPWIDPAREVKAAIAAKDHNLTALHDLHAKLGIDTEETLVQREIERREEETRGIVPPENVAAAQPDDEAEDNQTTEEAEQAELEEANA